MGIALHPPALTRRIHGTTTFYGLPNTDTLVIPENIRLILQPAYSPELNPVEHLWDYLRETYFHNCAAPTLKRVIEVLIDGLEQLGADVERIQSMEKFLHLRTIC